MWVWQKNCQIGRIRMPFQSSAYDWTQGHISYRNNFQCYNANEHFCQKCNNRLKRVNNGQYALKNQTKIKGSLKKPILCQSALPTLSGLIFGEI